MLYTCSPDCTDPRHLHAPGRLAHLRLPGFKAATTRAVARRRGGRSKVVDLHCHYLDPQVDAQTAHLDAPRHDPSMVFADELTRETSARQMKSRAPRLMQVEQRLKDMDRTGIDVQAVSPAPSQFFYFTEPGHGAQLARAVNEGIAKLVAGHPERFVGLGTVPLQDAQLAVRELDHAVQQLGLRGVEICTNVNGRNLTDPALGLDPFFARCEELGVLLFLHPSGYTQAERLTHHYFNDVIGHPLDTTVAVSHLIFDGVMARCPKLKVLVAHGGGYVAHYWARMDHAWRARPDCRTVIKRPPSKYLEKFYFDTVTHDTEMLRNLVTRFGSEHVVLGTDYPYDMGEEDPLGMLARVKRLPRADRDLIAGGNAARLLKLR